MLVLGSGWLVEQLGVVNLGWTAIWAFALVALGLGMIVTARTKSTSVPLVLLGAALTAGLAVGTSDIGLSGGVGQETNTPSLTADASPSYSLAVGELVVDLSKVAHNGKIQAHVGVGHLLVPRSQGRQRDRHLQHASRRRGGLRPSLRLGRAPQWKIDEKADNPAATVELDLDVTIGYIEIVRAG